VTSAHIIESPTIGDAWIAVAQLIMRAGVTSTYDGLAMREVLMALITVGNPEIEDEIIERFA